ncbi:MAG TPA: hypothetical protein ENI23_16910, partial [bacterium]|nr:hypothetical protein [bacterium]
MKFSLLTKIAIGALLLASGFAGNYVGSSLTDLNTLEVGAVGGGFWKVLGGEVRPILATWTIRADDDLDFYDEIQPDGTTCSDGEILKKTGADNWDCAADATGGGGGTGSNFTYVSDANGDFLTPSTTVGIIVSASSTFTALLNLSTSGLSLNGNTVTDFVGDTTISLSSGNLRVVDVNCTNCLNATEISDIYVLSAGDTNFSNFTFSNLALRADLNFIDGTGGSSITIDNAAVGFAGDALSIAAGRASSGGQEGGDLDLTAGDGVSAQGGHIILTPGRGSPVGNVGIGTTSPYATLSVEGEVVSQYFTATSSTNSLFVGGFLSTASSTIDSTLRVTGDLIGDSIIDADHFVATSSSATSTFAGGLTIETSGFVYDFSSNNVGIGTANPQELLHVGAGTDASDITATDLLVTRAGPSNLSVRDSTNGVETFIFSSSVGGIMGTVTNDPLDIKTNNTSAIFIDASQNVGIGTTSPSSILSVGDTGGINFRTATSTFSSTGGIDLESGCFAIAGTCIGGGAAGTVSNWTYVSDTLDFLKPSTTVGILVNASSTINANLRVGGAFSASSTGIFSDLLTLDGGFISNASSTHVGTLDVGVITGVDADEVSIALGGGSPTVDQIQEYLDNTGSSGFFLGGAISDGGSGTVDVAAGSGFIRTTNDDNAELQSFKWSASAGIAVTDNTTQYIYVDDAGTISLNSNEFLEKPDLIQIGVVTDEAGTIAHVFSLGVRLEESIGAAGRFIRRVHGIERNNRLGGLIFGQSGDANRDVTMTAGELEWGRTTYVITSFDTSGADTFQTYSATGQEDAVASQWPNAQFDSSGTLTTMINNRWANLFFFLEPDEHVVMIYGRSQFTSQALAEGEGVPSSSLPSKVSETGILVARFTFQKSANTATISSAFEALFANAGVTDHGDLAGLADDDHTQYVLADGTRNITGIQTFDAGLISTLQIYASSTLLLDGLATLGGGFIS